MTFTLVTGNQGKLTEWRRLLPHTLVVDAADIDLDEIQSLNLEEVVADKARRAYEVLKRPVVAEDVSAGLQKLGGLPGPFIKFFIKVLGEGALHILAGKEHEPASVACAVAYYDGQNLITVTGRVEGNVVAPRGEQGFGFDKVFVPHGQTKTYGEMTHQEKDAVSHRSAAISQLIDRLQVQGLIE